MTAARRVGLTAVVCLVCLAGGVGGPKEAQAKDSPWHLQVGLGTDFPLHLGGQLSVEMPAGLQLSTSIGHLLTSYVEVINAIARSFDAYEQETADLVLASWRDALVWRLHAGWRPLEEWGFFVEAGYGLVTLGSLVSGGDLVTVLEDDIRELLDEDALRYVQYDLTSTLHMLDLEVGWRWVLDSGWYFRVGLGVAATLVGETEIAPAGQRTETEQDAVISEGVRVHLNAIYRNHVHTPVVSLSAGIRLF
ncbi:MAG: hypothetical protein ACPGU1_20955 [Myxococcota bacterium]